MSIAPLLAASLAVQVHVLAATGAFLLGIVQLAAPKGTLPHRLLGWTWVGLMTIVCLSTFFIHEIRLWGPWSPIHLLSVGTLLALPVAVAHARRHAVAAHKRAMVAMFAGALLVAGTLAFMPGRVMHAVLAGKPVPGTAQSVSGSGATHR